MCFTSFYFNFYIKDKEELNKAYMKYEEKGGIYKSSEDLKIIRDMDNTVSDFLNEISIYERFMDKESENIIHSIRNEKELLKKLSDQLNRGTSKVLEESAEKLENFMNLFFDLAKLSGNEMPAN